MAYFHPAWLEHQRKRFTRPDGSRYLRPNGNLYLRPDASRFLRPMHPDERRYYARRPFHADVAAEIAAEIEVLRHLKSELAAIKA